MQHKLRLPQGYLLNVLLFYCREKYTVYDGGHLFTIVGFVMRFKIFALLLPFCLSACADENQNMSNTAKTTPAVNTTAKPVGQANAGQLVEVKSTDDAAPSKEKVHDLHQQLSQKTADTTCDSSAQCKVLAVGSRACGGPSKHIIYSTKNVDEAEVKQLAKQLTASEKQFNAETGMVSICQHLSAPSTQCIENKCAKIAGNGTSVY